MMKNLLNQTNLLLGATELNELVFANISIRENRTLSISFSLVIPTIIDNDYLLERFTSLMEDLPKEDLYDLLVKYDCKASNLIDTLFAYASVEEVLDISTFPEQIEVNGDDWVFESSGVGQIETRNVMSEYVDKDAYYKLMTLWQDFHLKQIDDDTIKEVEKIIAELTKCDSMEFIQDYIKECYYK